MHPPSDIESRADPDGLQEIRSWASRSPDSVRPGFRTRRQPGGLRLSSRLAAGLALALLLLLSLAGYRLLRNGRGTSDPTAVPEQVASSAPLPAAGAAPPAAATVPDSPQVRREPLRAPDTREAPPAPPPRERTPRTAAVRRELPKEPRTSRVVMSPEVFESEPAVLLTAPEADYPDAARGTGTSAEVTVGFTIDETGAVRDPAVESSRVEGDAPESLFLEAALAAAHRARFAPARERGVPTRSWSTLRFSFETGPPRTGA